MTDDQQRYLVVACRGAVARLKRIPQMPECLTDDPAMVRFYRSGVDIFLPEIKEIRAQLELAIADAEKKVPKKRKKKG